MTTTITIGLILSAIILMIIIKLLLGLKSESRFLKVDFPKGWEKKISQRYPLFNKLDESAKSLFKRKAQLLIAKRQIVGLEGLNINIDIRLAIASEISIITLSLKGLNPFKKLNPIAILPYEKYEEFKNRGAYTLYWDGVNNTLLLETPDNILLKGSYYMWLKVDKRFNSLSDEEKVKLSKELELIEVESSFDFSLF
jgi:hypothetical protein